MRARDAGDRHRRRPGRGLLDRVPGGRRRPASRPRPRSRIPPSVEHRGEPSRSRNRFGLSAPVIAGDVAVAVGADAVFGLDGSGEQVFAVDRAAGPRRPRPRPRSATGRRSCTRRWGDGPPPRPRRRGGSDPVGGSAGRGRLRRGRRGVTPWLPSIWRRGAWPPVPLDGVSRTGHRRRWVGVRRREQRRGDLGRPRRRRRRLAPGARCDARHPARRDRCHGAGGARRHRHAARDRRARRRHRRGGGGTSPRRDRPWSPPSPPTGVLRSPSSRACPRRRTSPTAPGAGAAA